MGKVLSCTEKEGRQYHRHPAVLVNTAMTWEHAIVQPTLQGFAVQVQEFVLCVQCCRPYSPTRSYLVRSESHTQARSCKYKMDDNLGVVLLASFLLASFSAGQMQPQTM